MFQDQSQEVARKARQRGNLPTAAFYPMSYPNASGPRVLYILPFSYKPPIGQASTSFFYRNFMNVNSVNEIDKPLIALRGQAADDDPISIVISCIGMAGMATQAKSSTLLTGARTRFGRALQLVNMALKDPLACKSDEILAVIMLLGIFEVRSS
jgi:hypothetical protein